MWLNMAAAVRRTIGIVAIVLKSEMEGQEEPTVTA
jgi:hypothetical protein